LRNCHIFGAGHVPKQQNYGAEVSEGTQPSLEGFYDCFQVPDTTNKFLDPTISQTPSIRGAMGDLCQDKPDIWAIFCQKETGRDLIPNF
jgi:hypothetical protein